MKRSKKRITFRPKVSEAQLEERLVLSSASAVEAGSTVSAAVAPATPLAAAPPIYSPLVISNAAPWRTVRQLRHAYTREVKLAALDLRNAVATDIQQLYADNNGDPTSQQMANLTASVEGAVDATALQLSSEASLLPASTNRLVPAIQKSLLGSGSTSLATKLNTILQSAGNMATAQKLQQTLGRVIAMAPSQLAGRFTNYFDTTSVNQLSVNSSGQQIPLEEYMANQLVSQLGNTLGSLAQSYPTVADSVLYPNGVAGTTGVQVASQALTGQFNTMASNALATAAMQLGSDLSLFSGYSSVASQLDPLLFGTTTAGTTGTTSGTGITSLASSLQNVLNGNTGLSSAVSNAFNTAYNSMLSPLDSFLGLSSSQSNVTLPTSGLTNPFGSQFTETGYYSGFNNGFATAAAYPGYVGFGAAPTYFNTSYGTGFNDMVTTITQNVGLSNPANGASTGGSVLP